MQVSLKILRFNPETDTKPHFESYTVDAEPTDRVLDALNTVKWTHDGTLTYRRSCAHGVCGSDAMRINGRNALACKLLIQDVGSSMTVEPLMGFRVIKDLVIDMTTFWDNFKKMKPYLINDDQPPTGRERPQSQIEREAFDDTTKCIMCAACTTSCPITWTNETFVGPAAIVAAHRFIYDSRDQAREERLGILNDKSGVWRCRTVFNCTDACPRDIKVTRAIEQVKRTILYDRM
jgi:succinate dehydrogenase / fumarate reductase, iron-sulfur subunit